MLIFLFLSLDIKFHKEKVLIKKLHSDWWIVPTITIDGRWILFNGKFKENEYDNIWGYNTETGSLVKILETDNEATAPFYDSDNNQLFFYCYCKKSGSYEICKYDFSKKEGKRITDNYIFDGFLKTDLNKKSYFVYQIKYLNKNTIILAFKDGDSLVRAKIYPPKLIDESLHPVFDPTADRIAFIFNDFSQKYGLYIYNIETGKVLVLLKDFEKPLYSPTFSPDGKYITFLNNKEENLYVINVKTGEYKRLTEGENYAFAWWSPKGNEIIATRYKTEGNHKIFSLVKIKLKGKDVPLDKTHGKRRYVIDFSKEDLPVQLILSGIPLVDKKYRLNWSPYYDQDYTKRIKEKYKKVTEIKTERKIKLKKKLIPYFIIFIVSGIIMTVLFIIRRFA